MRNVRILHACREAGNHRLSKGDLLYLWKIFHKKEKEYWEQKDPCGIVAQ